MNIKSNDEQLASHSTTTLDLLSCEKEQIHLVTSVQPHGLLLVLGEPELRVLQVSASVEAILGCDPAKAVGQLAETLFSESSIAQIKEILFAHHGEDFRTVERLCITTIDSSVSLQGMLHRYNGLTILETEENATPTNQELTALRHWISEDCPSLFRSTTIPSLLKTTAEKVQSISDFDRVLIYQFDKDWNGTVVAEQRRGFMRSYINQRFPASDIPSQARELYTKNLLRLLVDVDAVPSVITPAINPTTGQQLDLTYSILRTMSPIHIDYLRNMGVKSSMSISLMVKDKLWGLIVCHHSTAKTVDFVTRSLCETIARIVSSSIGRLEEQAITNGQLQLGIRLDQIVANLSKAGNLITSLSRQLPDLLSLTNAAGVALIGDDILEIYGSTPTKETAQEMFTWLKENIKEPIFCSDKLALDCPQWGQIASLASGFIGLDLSAKIPLWILWFRPEQIEEIIWAGNPHKPAEIKSGSEILGPRKSFELWKEIMRSRSRPWKSFEVEAALSLQKHILGLMLAEHIRKDHENNIQREEREDLLAILTHEMNGPAIAMDRILSTLVNNETANVPDDLRETLSVLKTGTCKQVARIQKLLQLLLYDVDKIRLDSTKIDCGEVIREAIAEVVVPAEQSQLQIITDVNQTNYNFKSDPKSIRYLVINLVENAVQATGSSGTIHVSGECSATGLRIQVADNGKGISPEDQTHLFDRFWQGGTAQPFTPKVGIGLNLCQRIVAALNGSISCESALAKGTTFTVLIPNL
jgi:light-regulated signal transduction histidine kinase (bacteriophytochrome)